jgi:hypothetical protein
MDAYLSIRARRAVRSSTEEAFRAQGGWKQAVDALVGSDRRCLSCLDLNVGHAGRSRGEYRQRLSELLASEDQWSTQRRGGDLAQERLGGGR